MELTILSGTANRSLSAYVASWLGRTLGACAIDRFPDGELHVEIGQSIRGHDVFLIQPTSPPVDAHLMELLLLADAARRAEARRVTAVVPYFGYARHDRRAKGREAVGARLVADLMHASGLHRVVAVDLHSATLEGYFGIPLIHLSAVRLLAAAIRQGLPPDAVVVSPDVGGAKLAERYARALELPMAIVHKTRQTGSDVSVRAIVGEVRGRAPVVVDDMISTGGTIEAAVRALHEAGCSSNVTVAASHALLVGPAIERLAALKVSRIVATDSVVRADDPRVPVATASLASLLGDAILRLHEERSVADLVIHA